MALEIVRASAEHVLELARILFEAFKGIHDRHRFPLDIPSMDVALMMVEMLVHRPDFYGVAAVLDGKIVGSNFTQISDGVSGVGPITVDPGCQARGVGRALMRHVVDWSLANHGPMVRLVQDGFNMASLSLYTSIGFTVVEPLVLMAVSPADHSDATVRPLVSSDLAGCHALCTRILKVSRKNELAFMIEQGGKAGFIPHGRFKAERLVAYVIPGFFGHGVAESAEDLLTTVTQAARHVPPPAHKVLIPARNGELFRRALGLKMRSIKLMSLMAIGPYEEPLPPESGAAWAPSIAY
ncbi:MAG: GNAT family N-acetyltransferase [Tepidisphaeraceae bacterium]|jgi:GNAT superfamily N-acetyltransferase